jgi:hypothetical protein
MREGIRERIEEFESLTRRFSRGHARRKLALLRQLKPLTVTDPHGLVRLHESLCFLRAFADNRLL